jgi:hypothetical protein
MTEMFPIPPVAPGHAVSIGLTSYDGGVYYGVNGDRDAMPDIAVLATLLEDSLAELVEAGAGAAEVAAVQITSSRSTRRPSGRRSAVRGRRETTL